MKPKAELLILLEERTLSNFERRRRRLLRIPMSVVTVAVEKARKGQPLTLQEYIASHLGFLPGELERLEKQTGRQRKQQEWVTPAPSMSDDVASRLVHKYSYI